MEDKNQVKSPFKGKYNHAVGRRKEAVARVKLYVGKGKIIINGKDYKEYFNSEIQQERIFAPFKAIGLKDDFDFDVIVRGGGKNGQIDAIIHAIARALKEKDDSLKVALRRSGLLTRDPRVKERKKYGLKRARKAPQFSKR
jgi:small subunit ribosomal protein S9